MTDAELDQLAINTIRTLSIDAVQAANSGHPGTPMALAPLVYTLWNRVMRFDPQDPIWPGRDRFVLSNGHASMLLWSVLHLTGTQAVNAEYETLGRPAVTLDDIRRFRQLGSHAPGHPEYHLVSGVETTTGPLGQGIATSVGMAIAQRWLAARYNKPDFAIFDYDIYAVCGDGCLMEGVGSEAASLAGHLGLDNLCWIYDNNHITIEGSTRLAFTEDVAVRFTGYGWNILHVSDANDIAGIEQALATFRDTKDRPTLVILNSHIGYGSPHRHDTAAAHGEPLGVEEVKLTKRAYGWPEDSNFLVPDGVREHFASGVGVRGAEAHRKWQDLFADYRSKYPALATEIDQMQQRKLPAGWDRNLPSFPADSKGIAGREASGKVLNVLAQNVPWLIGGSADLGPSTKTLLTYEGAGDVQAATPGGKNLHFGIREHAMAAILNGLALSKLRPFGATFLIFSDYARPAIRLAALMELPVIFVFTHDAMGDGEDGPTHQPIEHLASMRAMPGLTLFRPGDANEVVEAYRYVMQLRHRPALLVLSRQPLATLDRNKYAAASGVARGAYVLADAPDGKPDIILIATGSELSLAADTHERLIADGIRSRVVSMPSWDVFERETQEYRDAVLPPDVTARVAIEQASTFGWERYVGRTGRVIGMHTFGASAPLKALQQEFGFTVDHVMATAKSLLQPRKPHSMAGIGQPRHPVRLSMQGLPTRRRIRPATGKRSGLTSVSGPGARYVKTTAPTAKRGNTSPTSTRVRAPIVGTRMVSPASVTVTSASVSHWRSGTGAIRSSRNASLGSPARKEITARTQKSTGGTSMQHRRHRGCAGATTTRRPSFPMLCFDRRTQGATRTSPNSSWSIPEFSKAIATGRSRRTTPRHHRMMYACASACVTRDLIRLSFTFFRHCGSATAGPGRPGSSGRLSGRRRRRQWRRKRDRGRGTARPTGGSLPGRIRPESRRRCCSVRTKPTPDTSTAYRCSRRPIRRTASTTTSSMVRTTVNPAGQAPKWRAGIASKSLPAKRSSSGFASHAMCRTNPDLGAGFEQIHRRSEPEADEYYATLTPEDSSDDEAAVMRQAFAGMVWSQQFYHYDVARWLDGDTVPPPGRTQVRPQRGLAPSQQPRHHRDARQMGISLVCLLGPRLPLRGAGAHRSVRRETSTAAAGARMVHAPERPVAGV